MVQIAVVAPLLTLVSGVRVYRPWTVKHWCDSVTEPHWPFSYSKYQNQLLEHKGRVNSNIQDMRHKCSIAGVQSKCHICENIQCGAYKILQQPNVTNLFTFDERTSVFQGLVSESDFSETCSMQIQGVEWKDLSKNIPTVSDTAWAVGPATMHRYDFQQAERMCVMMSGGYCVSPYASDYSDCTVRCWGADSQEMLRRNHTGKIDATQLPRNNPHTHMGLQKWPLAGDYGATDSWERDRSSPVSTNGQHTAQGRVRTLAGDGIAGDLDGPAAQARFNSPHDVAIDNERNIYVADTKNNKIRKISAAGVVTTFAGTGAVGFKDGPANQATFSAPQGVTVYYDWRDSFRYKGCFRDEPPHRHLPDLLLADKQMTPTMCWRHCWSYKFFAVQRGTECRCGNALPPAAEGVDLHKCDTPCASYAGTPEDPPWGSRAWGVEAPPAADNYLAPGKDTFHGGGTNQWKRTDRGKCGGHNINSVYENRKGSGELQIFVADTGNHRIRLIRNGVVSCFAGRCGEGTFSKTLSMAMATPQPGYADGTGDVARFHTPMGVAVDSNGTVFVADTYNYLVRFIYYEGVVHTLAGGVDIAEKTPEGTVQPGCPPPCLKGVPGSRDGNLTNAQFAFPSDVTVGLNDTVVVTDSHRVRRITYSRHAMIDQDGDPRENVYLPASGYLATNRQIHVGSGYSDSTIQGVTSQDRVVTLAGESDPGRRDGKGYESSFNRPEGLAMDAEGRVYVSGTVSCRIRRISSAAQTAVPATCKTIATELIRPSGCASYNPPVDSLDFTATPKVGETYHRYAERLEKGTLTGYDLYGRRIYNCQGTPPVDALEKGGLVVDMHDGDIYEKSMFPENYELVWDKDLTGKQHSITEIKEDTNDGTTIKVLCPPGCSAAAPASEGIGDQAYGTDLYADYSSVCLAAIHAGAVEQSQGGLVTLSLHRGKRSRNATVQAGSARRGVSTLAMDGELPRVFSVETYPLAEVEVQTLAGPPGAVMENACGFADGLPPQETRFSKPAGLAMFVNSTLTMSEVLYVADTGNHRVRTMTAVCAQICENGGYCSAADRCTCPAGWGGKDCTLPVCMRGAAAIDPLCAKPRTVCVGPDKCACIPGYTGANCDEPMCVQTCRNGGHCAAPDTCECLPGWFDSNCTTPVCTQTCAHGGNCTAPNVCTCPAEWTGVDCRVPVCEQAEWNGHDGKLMLQSPGINTPAFTQRIGVHPVYKCRNGGYCTAPNTCTCPPQWSGHDCGLPVCSQGFMIPDDPKDPSYKPRGYKSADPKYKDMLTGYLGYSTTQLRQLMTWQQRKNEPLENGTLVERPRKWMQYTPCHVENWVKATNTFDFRQSRRTMTPVVVHGGGAHRNMNGWNYSAPSCLMMELGEDALSPYQYFDEFNKTTPYAIYTPKTPYGPDAVGHPWRAWTSPTRGRTGPWTYVRDRQLALVQLQEVQQGPYVCANGGSCVAPDICMCAPGWIGFDCRTPVCEQGYYEPEQLEFTAKDSTSIRGNVPHVKTHERQPDSNPAYMMEDQNLTYTDLVKSKRVYGDIRYLSTSKTMGGGPVQKGMQQKWTGQTGLHELLERLKMRYYRSNIINPDINSYRYQGGYSCSLRALTHWESPSETLGPGSEGSLYGRDTGETDGCHPSNSSCGKRWGKSRLFEHPNYFSRYMNRKVEKDGLVYTHWEGMEWQPTYVKTEPLLDDTREGHFRDGIWLPTGMIWEKGVCLMEFDRTCPHAPWKERDLAGGGRLHQLVTDTDASYRARVDYFYDRVRGPDGRWDEKGGECVDEVIRGCYNNGTCVAPNTCRCAPGWSGYDCSVPVCEQECLHNGNCTLPNICTCERGWTGASCEIPMCAQDCNNGGVCIAPDTCQCVTWPTKFYDNRFGGGRPLFRKPDGSPQSTGWTGYDCNTPICVQHEFFRLNYRTGSGNAQMGYDCSSHPHKEDCGWQTLYGRSRSDVGFTDTTPKEFPSRYYERPAPPFQIDLGGGLVQDLEALTPVPGRLVFLETEPLPGTCYEMNKIPDSDPPIYLTRWDEENGRFFLQSERSCPRQPWEGGTCAQKDRCMEYDQTVTENDGTYFQSGCALNDPRPRFNTVSNESAMTQILRLRDYQDTYNLNRTSNDFLCMVLKWYQGDYIDDGNSGMLRHGWHKLADKTLAQKAAMVAEGRDNKVRVTYFGQATTQCSSTGQWQGGAPFTEGASWQGTEGCELQTFTAGLLPMTTGRKVRKNHHRYRKIPGSVSKHGDEEWEEVDEGDSRRGEGVYACYNRGSCIYPDRCTCADGWTGFDCQTPLCRHKQTDPFLGHNNVASCLNGGLCSNKDNCTCIKTPSVLHEQFPDVPVGLTGFEGTDCSIAVCVQGFFDKDCVGVAPGGQGCYRCNNGGNCTAPDHCTCAEGWTGYDCMTPVCTQVANKQTRVDLFTVDEDRIHEFEMDPCGELGGRWGKENVWGLVLGQGNCTMPNVCTCLCKDYYHKDKCRKYGTHCRKSWRDPLGRGIPSGFTFGGAVRDFITYESDVIPAGEGESSRSCYDGYEGNVDSNLRFTSCHLKIYVPEWWERDSIILIAVAGALFFLGSVGYVVLRRKLKQRFLLAKAERRRSRKSSENQDTAGAFGHK